MTFIMKVDKCICFGFYFMFLSVCSLTMPHRSGIPDQRWYSIYLWKFKTNEKYIIKYRPIVPRVCVLQSRKYNDV